MSSNNTSSGEPNKTTGQYHSVKGTTVETIGNLTGAQSWQQSGKEEHAAGEAEYNAAQAKNWAEGAVDRVEGKKDFSCRRCVWRQGPTNSGRLGNLKHDKGQAQQDANSWSK
ncbi:hypothetical protein F5146DRAFT_999752 [Armillaria mellea]|nr:hypothetical protein F5146DRAFT_999752 [Armillaria mellea]